MSTATTPTTPRTRGCHATSVREEIDHISGAGLVSGLVALDATPVKHGGAASQAGRVDHALVHRTPSETPR
ncbi:hypothetical protein AB0C34_08970 [Nocardia sp. NPDC049220]|uniref:hypothetical protein n=1 Tax=Nocardia sp. NPDC049220 TaxID=3155273 RepID=UPI0033C1F5A4